MLPAQFIFHSDISQVRYGEEHEAWTIPLLMPRCLFRKPRSIFKCNFCSLQLLMLEEVTLWHLWKKPAIYLIHFALFLVNNYCSTIISTAKWSHNFFGPLPGLLLHRAILRKCGEANIGLEYQLKSKKCEQNRSIWIRKPHPQIFVYSVMLHSSTSTKDFRQYDKSWL